MLIALIYFTFGVLFTYLAYLHVEDTLWNPFTMLFLAVATVDFGAAYRYTRDFIKRYQDMNNRR